MKIIQRTQKQLHTKVNTYSVPNNVKNMQGYLVTARAWLFCHPCSFCGLLAVFLAWFAAALTLYSKGYWSLAVDIS
jgi:hypothetical protein